MSVQSDREFAGSIPATYDACLGPMLFEPYALELAERVRALAPGTVLETAAGTGIVTAALRAALAAGVPITATDLNQGMLDVAAAKPRLANVTWQQADAQALPFADGSFDVVVCQFGVMFFPDKAQSYREVVRVLKPGGTYLFAVWGVIENNPASEEIQRAIEAEFPNDPPQFLRRGPFSYADTALIEADLQAAGFSAIRCETVEKIGRSATIRAAATGLCQGSPMRAEIEARDAGRLEAVTAAAAAALAARFGPEPLAEKMEAFIITARR